MRTVAGTYTAQAFIITDLDDNQITAFHPGAMNESHQNRVGDVDGIALGIVAPDGRDGMRAHVREFAAAGIPFIFDPGQGLPLFSGTELIEMIDAPTSSPSTTTRGACSPSAPDCRSRRSRRASRR